MMSKFSWLLMRLRGAQNFNPFIHGKLLQLLQASGLASRILNVGMWLAFHVIFRGRLLRQNMRRYQLSGRQRALAPTPGKHLPPPWLDGIGKNPVCQGVLIIAELSIPQCRRYRVEQKVEGFALLGMPANVVSWTDQSAARNLMQTSALVIFYRTPALPEVLVLRDEARRLGLKTFFDIDDLVFDVAAYAQNSNLKKLPPAEQKNLLAGAELYCSMLCATDHAIASTPVLAEHMQPFCQGRVYLVENALDHDLLRLTEEAIAFPVSDRVIVGYGSGTRTHDADFALASAGLLRLLTAWPQVDLVIFGYLELPATFSPFLSRVRRIPFLAAHDYYRALRQFDINLAPLEGGVFNDAKSNIKFIEAAAFGIPTVASPCAAFTQVIRHGENGFIAGNADEWFASLAALVQDKALRQKLGQRAKADALAHYALPNIARSSLAPLIAAGEIPRPAKRRIMVVNVLFSPISFGGATVVAEQLALGLAAQADTEVCVVTGCFDETLAPGESRQYSWHGLSIFAIRLLPGSKVDEYDNPYTSPCFATILDVVQPDLVHFHSIQILGANLANVCVDRNIPYLISLHDAWWLCELQFMVNDKGYCAQKAIDPLVCAACVSDPAATYRRRFVLQKALENASKLLAPSAFQRELYVCSGQAAGHVVVNKNGVLPANPGVSKRHASDEGLVFAFLGGRATHKGYFWLKQIFEGIDASNYTLKLVDIQARFGASGMESDAWKIKGKLEIAPPFEVDQIDDFYADVDVLLFPSQWKESFGLTVREAMIRNIWVIATDCGGPVEDLVSGVNGVQLAMDDMLGFRQAVLDCINDQARVKNYRNPLIDQVRTFAEQSLELSEIIDQVLAESYLIDGVA